MGRQLILNPAGTKKLKLLNLGEDVGNLLLRSNQPESLALFARMDVQPSYALSYFIDNIIKGLKDNNFWNRMSVLYFLNLHTEQASLLNIKSDTKNLATISDPVFQPYKGYKGDGVIDGLSGSYTPSELGLDAENFSIGAYSKEFISAPGYYCGLGTNSAGGYILPRYHNGVFYGYISDQTLNTFTNTSVTSDSVLVIQRDSSTAKQLIYNSSYQSFNVNIMRDVHASGFSTTRSFEILRGYGVEALSWIGGLWFGEAFTSDEHLILSNLFNAFKDNVYTLSV